GSSREIVRLRNRWITVDPRDWKARNDMTIHVGLGTGSKTEQLAHLTSLIGLQKEALAAGKTNLVSDDNLYNSAKELTKLLGLKNVDRYFTDPRSQPAQPAPAAANPLLVELQRKNQIETARAQADIAAQQKKIESEMALAQQRFELDRQLKLLD